VSAVGVLGGYAGLSALADQAHGKTYADHNLAEIRTTQTAWTLVRAVGLSNSDKPKTLHTTEAGLGVKPGLLISRRAIAGSL
jgi:hypothetical protein